MKYVYLDNRGGDIDSRDFATAEEAVKHAKSVFCHLTDSEKKNIDFFGVIEAANEDPEALNHIEGPVVWEAFRVEVCFHNWVEGSGFSYLETIDNCFMTSDESAESMAENYAEDYKNESGTIEIWRPYDFNGSAKLAEVRIK